MLRVMIVDDSSVARAVLSRMISAQPDFIVVAVAVDGREALAQLRTVDVDIVLLDMEMPRGNGLDILPEILRDGRGARVLVLSSLCEEDSEGSLRAMALGAADTLPKPGSGIFAGRFSQVLADRMRRIGPAGGTVPQPANANGIILKRESASRPHCLAIGASTGGLHAITDFLAALPDRIGIPLLVTQHLPPLFIPYFAKQLQTACGRTTRVAEEGAPIAPDEIVLAPGDAHLCLDQHGSRIRAHLTRKPEANGHLPSLDPMFDSVATVYAQGAVGIVLSGMGRDGLSGARRIADRGGTLFVQDPASSAVWGMPRAVAEAGLASAMLDPTALGGLVGARLEAGA